MGKLEAQSSGKLPSQTEINPRENVSVISLRSGKEIKTPKPPGFEKKDNLEKKEQSPEVLSQPKSNSFTNCIPLPFPCRRNKSKKEELERELLETFRKVEVNIPLLDAIKQVPRYAKLDRKSTRLNSSHSGESRMPSSA